MIDADVSGRTRQSLAKSRRGMPPAAVAAAPPGKRLDLVWAAERKEGRKEARAHSPSKPIIGFAGRASLIYS